MTYHVDNEEIPVCPVCRRAMDLEDSAKFPPHTMRPGATEFDRGPLCVTSGKSWAWAQVYARQIKIMEPK